MSRIRSPGYPSFSLPEAIEFAEKVHKQDRQYPVAREVACQHMGFSGTSGSSDRAISALYHYGLAEKFAKGELRITDLAVRIIHPDSAAERRLALHEAGFGPELFKEMREKYTGSPPSLSTITSYLSRQGFAPVAIGPASKAYAATCDFLQRENAYESVSIEDDFDAASPSIQRREEPLPVSTQIAPIPQPALQPPVIVASPPVDLELNEPNLSIRGSTVRIEALLDFDGLGELEDKIAALKMLMKPSAKASRAVVIAPPAPVNDDPDWNNP